MFSFLYLDVAVPFQLGFQDPATPVMEGIIDLHHHINFFLLVILLSVIFFLKKLLNYFMILPETLEELSSNYYYDEETYFYYKDKLFNSLTQELNLRYQIPLEQMQSVSNFFHFIIVYLYISKIKKLNSIIHHHNLEIIWTMIPTLILIVIAIPSFALLYSIDEIVNPAITIKCMGHQWYWCYEYSDYCLKSENGNLFLNFESYMIPEDDLNEGDFRLLEVDDFIVVPTEVHVRLIISASDVLHSWAVPSLGVKIDAVPGRLNQASFFIKREGIFYGQCSEICGVNHGFMPIVVKATSLENYISWISNKLENV
uniref:Cytochrome c oxidase subunit 2 n=1 Tax=Paravannella minima TaxID=1443144 RepID=A0A411K7P0_9EUKA|nr:cytochrome oxidase subunit 2 [Paravannella minima]QBC73451.1 cytochrome oxidase subunit 2 [Paravannella minima]